MPVEVKLHGNMVLGGGPSSVIFEKAFSAKDFPELKIINDAVSMIHFAGGLSDALEDAGIPNVGSLSWFPSVDETAYWGGATIDLPGENRQVGILFPKSEAAYQSTELPKGCFTLNQFAFNQKKPDPFGPLLLVKGEVPQDNLPEIIEVISQAYQQLTPKLAAPFN